MPGRRLRLREKRNVPKVTLPISHEARVTTQKAGLSGSKPTLSLPCYILELLGKEKSGERREAFPAKSEICAPTSQGLSLYLISIWKRLTEGLLMELIGSNYKSRGMKGKEDNGWFL